MEFFIFWIICGIAASYVAKQKGKAAWAWFVVGIILGPLALLMVGLSPAAPAKVNSHSAYTQPEPAQRKCPFCAEDIKFEAIVCKHCGRDVPALPPPASEPLIKKCYDSLQREFGGACSQGRARLELEKQGFDPRDIADFLDTLPR